MEKKQLYTAPAVRNFGLKYEVSFLQSAGANIEDWLEDNDPINF